MDGSDSINNNQVYCIKCNALLELEPQEIESKIFICPECGEENNMNEKDDFIKDEKSLLVNDSIAECVHCGQPNEPKEMEILSRSYTCGECGMINKLEIKPEFHTFIDNENASRCGNCGFEVELEPEEILAGIFFCPECERINSVEYRKIYAKLRENNEVRCIHCDRKLILEKDEIDKKMFFCPKCGVENFLE